MVTQVDPLSGEPRHRSCIRNLTSGARFFEMPVKIKDGVEVRPTWHVTLDQGSIGFPGMVFYALGLGARCTLSWDRLHRVTND